MDYDLIVRNGVLRSDVKKKVNELSGDLKIARVNKLVRNLLETTSLIKKIETYDDIDSAVKSFNGQKK